MHSLAQHFFSLVRAHSQLKRAADSRSLVRNVRAVREVSQGPQKVRQGGAGWWGCTTFNATSFFTEIYHSGPWMPTPSPPQVEFVCSPFSASEVARVIKRMKAPSPFDRVGYIILKKCPSLLPALVQLFNMCWFQSITLEEWNTPSHSSLRPQQLKMPPTQATSDQLH